ncbi:phage virion morphogenesis protein [Neisseria iguanae]|uniref:phage virion morphogenesis protein n=1 Tax=Neisseria iguanae TaxID=90242 RepID=UPI001FE908E9|nr:phage virion morphogenesis protein [Neisseria iguanae]
MTGQSAASISIRVGNDFAQIGSNKKYAAIHHLGSQAVRGRKVTILARPYLPINGSGQLQNGAEKKLIDITLESLKAGL